MQAQTIGDQWKILADEIKSVPLNLEHLAARLGVKLHAAYLDDEILGMIEKYGDTFRITLNCETTDWQQRFTLAHELGHYMLHRYLIGDGLDDARGYRSINVGKYHNTNIGPKQETEANGFAVTILLPMGIVKREWAKHDNDEGDETIRLMAEKFQVSKGAMRIRLGLA